MRFLKIFTGLISALLLITTAAKAADVALIIGDTGQVQALQNPDGVSSQAFAAPLRQAGFQVIQPRDRSSKKMRAAAHRIEPALANGQIDRLIIILLGPYARSERESWILSNDAAGATGISVALKGISINALSDLAAQADGRAVIMLADGAKMGSLGQGLESGLGKFARADDVTYITGGADKLVDVLQYGLLDPDKTYADAARDAPRGVIFSGLVSRQVGLMGGGQSAASPELIEQGFWQAIDAIDSADGYKIYLDHYPDGKFSRNAQNRIERIKSEPEREARRAEQSLNLNRDARRRIQRDLTLLDFNPRGIDGVFGGGSRAAIKAWQRDNSFDQTGFLTGNQVSRLRDQALRRADELEEEAQQQRAEDERQDQAYWWKTGSSGEEDDLLDYLEKYPDGLYAARANSELDRIEETRPGGITRAERNAWDTAREGNTIAGYKSFLRAYPDSKFYDEAQSRIRELQKDRVNAAAIQQDKAQEKQIAAAKFTRKLIEQRLARFGTKPGKVDGKFDKYTRKAIRRFQRKQGLPVTGYVSRATMVRLMGGG